MLSLFPFANALVIFFRRLSALETSVKPWFSDALHHSVFMTGLMILLCACFPVASLILVFARCCLLISFLLSRSPFFPPFLPLPRPHFSHTWSNSLFHDLTSLALLRLYDFAFLRSFHLFHSFPFCALSTCYRFGFLALPTGSTILSFSIFADNSKCRPSILYWIHRDRKKNLYLLTAGALKKTSERYGVGPKGKPK